jgi:hypothetical protein
MGFTEKHKNLLATVIIVLTAVFLYWLLPGPEQYSRGADEDNYYRQGKLIADKGLEGFKITGHDYVQNLELHDTPNPLRIGSTLAVAAFLKVHNSLRSVSLFCSLCYLLFLAGAFLFVSRFWGAAWGVTTLLLLAVSPLELAMARRALMDMPAMAFSSLSCFLFWRASRSGKRADVIAFILLFIAAISIKETSVLLLPFFALVLLYLKVKNETPLSFPVVGVLLFIPPLVMGCAYLVAFGFNNLRDILHTMALPSQYSAYWGQGPWYRTHAA